MIPKITSTSLAVIFVSKITAKLLLILFSEIIGSYSENDKRLKNTPCKLLFKIKTGGNYRY